MNHFSLSVGGKVWSYSGPSTYAELTPHQAVGIARLQASVTDNNAYLFAGLQLLYGIKRKQLRWLMDERFLRRQGYSPDEIEKSLTAGVALIETLSWIGSPDPKALTVIPHFRLYDYQFGNPITWWKRLQHRTLYVGPQDALKNVTFEAYMYADAAYRARDINRLVAILYLPQGEAFNKETVDARSALFARLDNGLKKAIIRQFEDAQQVLARYFKAVFEPETDDDKSKNKGGNSTWLDVAISMAKHDVTKIPQIEKTNLYLVLKNLNSQIRMNEELQRKIDKR